LAKLVGDGANLAPGSRVLDLGYGCGDQTMLFLKSYPIAELVGVTSETLQSDLANRLVAAQSTSTRVHLLTGNAVDPNTWRATPPNALPSNLTLPSSYDAVLSLDSAYHYSPSRAAMWSLAATLLRPNGTLSCTDIILGDGAPSWWIRAAIRMGVAAAGVPWANMVQQDEYVAGLKGAGFADVVVRDISEKVFGGLADFIGSHRERVGWVVDSDRGWRQYVIMRRLLRWVDEMRLLRFVVVSARRV
ncbi:S-adenosyl-L-methionine-dependent methyltransferase, partial [Blyttiomyces helicus]